MNISQELYQELKEFCEKQSEFANSQPNCFEYKAGIGDATDSILAFLYDYLEVKEPKKISLKNIVQKMGQE